MSGEVVGGPSRSVLEGTFTVLDVLEDAGEAGLTHLSRASGLPKATVYRLLQQLATLGAVEKRNGRYRIGPRIQAYSLARSPDPALLRAIEAPIRGVARATGASIAVGISQFSQLHVLRAVSGMSAGLVPMDPGMVWPRGSAASQIVDAWAVEGRPGNRSPMSRTQATEIRESGVVFDRQKVLPNVCCVAVPLMRVDHQAPHLVLSAIVNPSYRLDQLAAVLTRTSAVIAALLPDVARPA